MATSGDIRIRERTDNDLDDCIELLTRVHQNSGYPVNGVSKPFLQYSGLEQAFVAILEDKIIGHVCISKARDSDISAALWQRKYPETKIAILERLFIDPEHQGKGIAGRLIATAVEQAHAVGLRLVLFVLKKDPVAKKLYERLGWVEFGRDKYRYGEGQEMDATCFVSPAKVEA